MKKKIYLFIGSLILVLLTAAVFATARYLANRSRFMHDDPSPTYTDQDETPTAPDASAPLIPSGSQEMSANDRNDEFEQTDITSLDDFYHTAPAQDHDIRELPEEYSSFDAQLDNCFVIGAMVHNDHLYGEFMEDQKNKTSSFIRVVQNTVEGDAVLYDILYYEKTDKLYLVTDRTRDRFSAEADRKIELREFDNIAEYGYENHLYWILYRGEVNDDNFRSDDVFIITMID